MTNNQLNEPAFPIRGGLHEHQFIGMSLRDYFAAHALPALIRVCVNDARRNDLSLQDYIAGRAYEMADAMLAMREYNADPSERAPG